VTSEYCVASDVTTKLPREQIIGGLLSSQKQMFLCRNKMCVTLTQLFIPIFQYPMGSCKTNSTHTLIKQFKEEVQCWN